MSDYSPIERHEYVADCDCRDCAVTTNRELRARIAELEAQQRAGMPEGFVLVPVEPTDEMVEAGCKQHTCVQQDTWYSNSEISEYDVVAIFRAMIAAAPAPAPEAQEHVPVDSETAAQITALVAAGRIEMPQPAEVGADERASFDRSDIRDVFGQVPSYRERNLMFAAWQKRAQLTEGADALREENDRLWMTFATLADKLGIDAEAARKAPGQPSDVFWNAIQALTAAGGDKREALAAEVARSHAECDAIAELNHAQWLVIEKFSTLVAAWNHIVAAAEECETDDGMAVTIQLDYWHGFTDALDAMGAELVASQPAQEVPHD